MLPFSARLYPQDWYRTPTMQEGGLGASTLESLETISADARVCVTSCIYLTTACDAAPQAAISLPDDFWNFPRVEQQESAAWMTTNKNFSRSDLSVSPYVVKTTAFFHAVLHLLSVIQSEVGKSAEVIKDEHKDVILMSAATVGVVFGCFMFCFEVRRFLWDTWGFLSHVHKLAIHTSALCFESAYLICRCVLIVLCLGFIAVQTNLIWKGSYARRYWKHMLLKTLTEVHEDEMFHLAIKYGYFPFYFNHILYVNSSGIHKFPLIIHWPEGTAFDAMTHIASLSLR